MSTKLTTISVGLDKKNEPGFLTPDNIAMINKALHKVGEFGEVHLVVEKGCLRYVVVQQSFDALRWQAE